MSNRHVIPCLISVLGLAGGLVWPGPDDDHWPQWRGPRMDGSAQARDLPVTWSETDNVRWRARLPSWSAATPIVWGDTVFVTSAQEGFAELGGGPRPRSAGVASADRIFLIALDRRDGSIRWKREVDAGNQLFRKQNSASPSPITDGVDVWVMTGNGRLTCLTMEGKEVWRRDIQARLCLHPPAPRGPPLRTGPPRDEDPRSLLRLRGGQGDGQDDLEGRAAHRRGLRVAGQLHHPADCLRLGQAAARDLRGRLRHRPRPGDGPGAVAPGWLQPFARLGQPHHLLGAGGGGHRDLRG